MAGLAWAVSTSSAGSMGTQGGTIGGPLTELSAAGGAEASQDGWSDTARRSAATHRLTLTAVEVRRRYGCRSHLEEVIRVCTEQLGLTGGQARSARAPRHPLACGLVA